MNVILLKVRKRVAAGKEMTKMILSNLQLKIKSCLKYLKCYLQVLLFPNKYIVIQAALKSIDGKLVNYNWGDDLNLVLINFITSKKILVLSRCALSKFLPIKNYIAIGSIITFCELDNSYIWGSGIINENEIDKISGKPLKIFAVRGPRTRDALLKRGIDCPEVYGDPAILMPRFYSPQGGEVIYRIGIIPHYIDIDNCYVKSLLKEESTKYIKVLEYDRWETFIDDICSCEVVVSSSLHGLIIAEAYGVPAIWAKFGEYVDGWDFKFLDFYDSIGKTTVQPLIMNADITGDMIYDMGMNWSPGFLDADKLFNSCPFRE